MGLFGTKMSPKKPYESPLSQTKNPCLWAFHALSCGMGVKLSHL
ncbi:hypothetical protein HHE03_15650 [Helicobacter heilmannii]|uniref:Uncharacterized protein n=1 Tax=Helicobacter heilmannii TaxID=35817 RepID=A0A0K2XUV7_HELHE|nr:hypothetical protein BN341_7150 [Helicobacter heilmannii ASB1.4]CRF49887.1 hypothetical protein HHE03_15650 [Helicobacter heilmannii]CRI34422.1 hypothetical protein HHE01_12680 [Helicobacter heilmannii]